MLGFSEYWPLLAASIQPIADVESISVHDVLGRVLAADAASQWPVPRFTNSAMDGYAVRFDEVKLDVSMAIATTSYAGAADVDDVVPRNCVATIATGGRVPTSLDTIIPRENVTTNDGHIVVQKLPTMQGQHVRRQGEEIAVGDTVFARGTRLGCAHIAALLSTGVHEVAVVRQPTVAVLVTGDEVVAENVGENQIPDTNGDFLCRSLEQEFGITADLLYVGDQHQLVVDRFASLDTYDVIISTGGVSVGDKDFVRSGSQAAGYDELLWRVAMKPGKPVYLAQKQGATLLGLPGNPAAVFAHYFVTVVPVVQLLLGRWNATTYTQKHEMDFDGVSPAPRTQLLWCRRGNSGASPQRLVPMRQQNSHMLIQAAHASHLVIVPAASEIDSDVPARLSAIQLGW